MSDKEKESQVWLSFACAAIAGYSPDEELETFDDLVEDIIDVSTTVADNMLSEYSARYGARDRGPRSPSKRARSSKGGGGRNRGGNGRRSPKEEEETEE